MGDMADFTNDSYGYWEEEYEDAYDGGYWPKEKKQIKCNKCGSTDVYWEQYPSGKWFLFTDGKPHVCGNKIALTRNTYSSSKKNTNLPYGYSYNKNTSYNRKKFCPYCGIEYGMAPGTGDCGCSVDPE